MRGRESNPWEWLMSPRKVFSGAAPLAEDEIDIGPDEELYLVFIMSRNRWIDHFVALEIQHD